MAFRFTLRSVELSLATEKAIVEAVVPGPDNNVGIPPRDAAAPRGGGSPLIGVVVAQLVSKLIGAVSADELSASNAHETPAVPAT